MDEVLQVQCGCFVLATFSVQHSTFYKSVFLWNVRRYGVLPAMRFGLFPCHVSRKTFVNERCHVRSKVFLKGHKRLTSQTGLF